MTVLVLWACSGPGADMAIARAEWLGWGLFAASVVAASSTTALARRWGPLLPFVPLLLAHPGWWMSARMGDCGMMRVTGSIAVTALVGLLTGGLIAWEAWRRQRP